MKFLDQAKIYIRSGDGGAGALSFRREKFIEFGGPDGGDGGRGGDVVATCVDGLNTLIDYRYQQHFKAKTGGHGMGKNRGGRQRRRRCPQSPGRAPKFTRRTAKRSSPTSPRSAKGSCSPKAATAASAMRISPPRPIARRAASIPARKGDERTLLSAPETDRRRRSRRPAQRRQIDLSRRRLGGEAEDRRLSIHDPLSRSRRREVGR